MANWTQFGVTTTDHTVQTEAGLVAGHLVRCSRSRKDLGYIWTTGSEWHWRTPDGRAYGSRSTIRAAFETLRDIAALPQRQPTLFDSEPVTRPVTFTPARTVPSAPHKPKLTPAPAPIPAPVAPVRHIDWTASVDLTAAIRAALSRQESRS